MGRTNLKVELLRYTPGPEEIVAMGAKLCYTNSDLGDLKKGVNAKDQGPFIDKLLAMDHLSPIEHASFTFGVEGVSRSLLAQITRHRIASFSVKSQRYVSEQSRQGECFNYIIPPSIEALGDEAVEEFHEQMLTIQGWYDQWLERLGKKGEKSNEDARFVLPNATETKMLVTMNARELLHFFNLRCCNRAQWEIRALAIEMLRLCKKVAPNIFNTAGPGCLVGPCPEGKFTCGQAKEMRVKFLGSV
jgi:thymidylate synthase (FAD)